MPSNTSALFQKKNVLVTGGSGFIGSHLCERLLRDQCHVICIDNFSTSQHTNISHLLGNPDFQFLRLDINQPFDLEAFSELAPFKIPFQGIQEIYHLACPTSITKFDQFKMQTLLSCSLGNYHILELAKKYRARFQLASSSVVYGPRNSEVLKVNETQLGLVDQLSERSCYDEGKRYSETMAATYAQVHQLDVRIARIFRTYGPRMPLYDGHLIPDFILNAMDGQDLLIYEHGKFRTSLAYVTDVVDGMLRLMNAPQNPGPTNIGSEVDVEITEIANMIIKMLGSSSRIVPAKDLLFLSELPLPNIQKAKELGWFPLVRLEDGLRRTIEYTKANKILLTTI